MENNSEKNKRTKKEERNKRKKNDYLENRTHNRHFQLKIVTTKSPSLPCKIIWLTKVSETRG